MVIDGVADRSCSQGEGARAVPLSGHVGFDSMPDQLVNKSVNHGFCFNILCVGEYIMHEMSFFS